MEQQKAPVRAQQAAGADAGEIGHQHLAIGLVFDAPQQLTVGRVVLLHHRRALQVVVVHRHIHAQSVQQALQGLQPQAVVLVVAGLEQLDMLKYLLLQGLQPGLQPRLLGGDGVQALANVLPFTLEQGPHDLAAQCRQPLVADMFQRMRLFQKAGDLLAQAGFIQVDLGALLRAQAHGLACCQGLALIVLAGEHQMTLVTHQAEMPRLGVGVEFGIGARLLALEGLFDALAPGLDIGFCQAAGNVGLQAPDQLQHVLAQLATFASGQAQRQWPLGLRHMVQKQQVGRRRADAGHIVHELAHERGAAGADLTHHQQVVVRHDHAQAEPGRRFGTPLAYPGQGLILQRTRAGKAQFARIHPAQQVLGF